MPPPSSYRDSRLRTYPVDTDLKQQVEERRGVVKATERIMDVLTEVGANRAI